MEGEPARRKMGVPLEDWKQWRTEVNNCLVKKMTTGDPGRTFVPFTEYLDYPTDGATEERASQLSQTAVPGNLFVYSNARQNKTALQKRDFLNYGIPRVSRSVTDRALTDEVSVPTRSAIETALGTMNFEVEVPESQVEFDIAKGHNSAKIFADADTQTAEEEEEEEGKSFTRKLFSTKDSVRVVKRERTKKRGLPDYSYAQRIVDDSVLRRRPDAGGQRGRSRPHSMFDTTNVEAMAEELSRNDAGKMGAVVTLYQKHPGLGRRQQDWDARRADGAVEDFRRASVQNRLPRTTFRDDKPRERHQPPGAPRNFQRPQQQAKQASAVPLWPGKAPMQRAYVREKSADRQGVLGRDRSADRQGALGGRDRSADRQGALGGRDRLVVPQREVPSKNPHFKPPATYTVDQKHNHGQKPKKHRRKSRLPFWPDRRN